jgi:phosphopantothenoylcysteine synthetase/decarboxylase
MAVDLKKSKEAEIKETRERERERETKKTEDVQTADRIQKGNLMAEKKKNGVLLLIVVADDADDDEGDEALGKMQKMHETRRIKAMRRSRE